MKTISTIELKALMGSNSINLIDVRETYEHQMGHVPGAINIPLNTLIANPDQYLTKDKVYYIICQSGNRSALACNLLSNFGYAVYNVLGGHSAWPGSFVK